MIPKILHYCWFGGNPKSKLIKKCIKSWKTHLPDYKIICWDETNSELDIPFVKEAYKEKKWAFVSDYIRLKILYDYGGIYLDTDMLVVKNFNDLLKNQCFFGFVQPEFIETAIIGSKKGHPFILSCVNQYKKSAKFEIGNLNNMTSPKLVTQSFVEFYNREVYFKDKITLKDITIYTKDYFFSLPVRLRYVKNYKNFINEKSYALHLWDASWATIPAFKLIRQKYYARGIKAMFKEIFIGKGLSFKYYRKIASSFKQSLSKNNN